MHTSKLTVARLFNLGNYEHVRYEVSVDLQPGESAAKILTNLETVLEAVDPKTTIPTWKDLEQTESRLVEAKNDLSKLGEVEFKSKHALYMTDVAGYLAESLAAVETNKERRRKYDETQAKARAALDNLGAEITWKDAKKDWEDPDDEQF